MVLSPSWFLSWLMNLFMTLGRDAVMSMSGGCESQEVEFQRPEHPGDKRDSERP